MIHIEIPGYDTLDLAFLVMDYNGTLAIDGHLIPGVAQRLKQLARQMEIHIITADTFGLAAQNLQGLPVQLTVISASDQGKQKAQYVRKLGDDHSVAIGNGRNDRFMLMEAKLGIATIQKEGAATDTTQAANIVVHHINDALDLLLNPLRLKATLRD